MESRELSWAVKGSWSWEGTEVEGVSGLDWLEELAGQMCLCVRGAHEDSWCCLEGNWRSQDLTRRVVNIYV